MLLKKIAITTLAALLLLSSSALADTAADTIPGIGTTQAFKEEPVAREDLETILLAGLSAASAMNQQPWYYVAVTDRACMDEIAGSGMSFGAPAGSAPAGNGAPAVPEGAAPGAPGGSMPAMPSAGGSAKAALGDSPAAIIVYKDGATKSPNADFDCGLATQNMVVAAASLGYGVKIVSSPTMSLNGANHDALCEKLGVDPSMQAVAVLLIGRADDTVDGATGATTRLGLDEKVSFID